MKKTLLLIALLFATINVFSQNKTLLDTKETHNLSMEVTRLFSENKLNEAFKKLEPYWAISMGEIKSIKEKTLKYLGMINNRFEGIIGSAEGKTETINDFAIRETYFVLYNLSAIRLKFTYYKSNKGWIINSFKWDDSFEVEFSEN